MLVLTLQVTSTSTILWTPQEVNASKSCDPWHMLQISSPKIKACDFWSSWLLWEMICSRWGATEEFVSWPANALGRLGREILFADPMDHMRCTAEFLSSKPDNLTHKYSSHYFWFCIWITKWINAQMPLSLPGMPEKRWGRLKIQGLLLAYLTNE